MPASAPQDDRQRRAIIVRGVVQGVGFRPFVYNAARAEGLAGSVRNEADRVRIDVQGPARAIERLLATLRRQPPPAARITSIDVEPLAVDEQLPPGQFQIDTSGGSAAPRPTIPADLATCAACLEEIRTPGERRYRYPFTNCTACGPRWSIIESLPYDRPKTSMSRFTMCEACRREYEDPADRRFHAQPIACPRCGPRLTLLDARGHKLAELDDALRRAAEVILAGKIIAMKGLGGFQLLCDATNERAVRRLRDRKRRPDRPFAVMLVSLQQAQRCCEVSQQEAAVLTSPEAPIVLMRRHDASSVREETPSTSIVEAVAPGNPYLGVMLPYTPLHHLLLDRVDRPIVCTSGNLSDEPMAIDTAEAVTRLGPIADVILTHERPIVRPVDDSVVRVDAEGLQILRRARGYAPRPLRLPGPLAEPILAVGGHLKNAVAVALPGEQPEAVVGSHIGDLDTVASLGVHGRAIDDLLGFFDLRPTTIACDLHPDYASTREAERRAALDDANGPTLLRVQHHHAHVAAVMAEHGLEGPVLGCSWDGTGYGIDGTVWGGEILRCHRGDYRRVGHLRPFPLPGGEKATREPRRSALGLLWEYFGGDRKRIAPIAEGWFARDELDVLLGALERGVNCPATSSIGRLFDAVAALVGLPPVISFEGQAAMVLEYAVGWDEDDRDKDEAYALPLAGSVADWAPLVGSLLADLQAGVPRGRIAARFHHALSDLPVRAAAEAGLSDVILTGGCFQNAVLSDLARRRLNEAGCRVYTARETPPGDGGVAFGQLAVAVYHANKSLTTA